MEKPAQFNCRGKRLYGIFHLPVNEHAVNRIILMVIGGPQTRIGSHRLYVQLARALCEQGLAVFRFDYEGLGDSEGDFVGFEGAGPSIRAALDFLETKLPALGEVIIWSLCDGATACAIYAPQDRQRITAMILCNPYVHLEGVQAQTVLKHYYLRRCFEKEFWQKVFSFRFDVKVSLLSFGNLMKLAVDQNNSNGFNPQEKLSDRMIRGLCAFSKPVRILLSTNDLTAMEFRDLLKSRTELKSLMRSSQLAVRFIRGADHTFSRRQFKQIVLEETFAAIQEFEKKPSAAFQYTFNGAALQKAA